MEKNYRDLWSKQLCGLYVSNLVSRHNSFHTQNEKWNPMESFFFVIFVQHLKQVVTQCSRYLKYGQEKETQGSPSKM